MATLKAVDILKRAMVLIESRQFDEALSFLQHQAANAGLSSHVDNIQVLRDTYDNLLTQFTEANLNPAAEDDYNALMLQFFDQLQGLCFNLEVPNSNHPIRVSEYVDSLLKNRSDKALCELFRMACMCTRYTDRDKSALHHFIMNEDVPVYMRCTVLSAVMLYLFMHFDTEMLENIYAYTLDDQPDQIRWQAWVTMILCAVVHPLRIEHCDRIREQYQFMAESEPDLFLSMQLTLLQCNEADTIHEKVTKMMEKKGDEEEKAKRIFQYVAEGADISYEAFKMMRHIEFFANPLVSAHWLMPFSPDQEVVKSMLEQVPQAKSMVDLLSKSLAQSEQDKYGSIMMLIGNNINLLEQLSAQLKESGLELDKVMEPSGEILMRNYMHDVYRFFTLSLLGQSLPVSPFRENLDLGRLSWLSPALSSSKALKAIGEYLTNHENWDGATAIYSRLTNIENSEFALQRLGYVASKRQTRNLQLECDPLIRCNKLYPGNAWTLLHLARFYVRTGILSAAEMHLQEALQIEPNNTELLNELAECYIGMQLFDKALAIYFKLDIQKEGDVKTQRKIARCAFLAHNMDAANKYMQLVLEQRKPIIADWALAGCLALKDSDIEKFLDCFNHIGTLRSRLVNFDTNIDTMTKGGVPKHLITIARDALNKV